MSELLKGFFAVAVAPNQIRVQWDWITRLGFEGVQIDWWCIGEPVTLTSGLVRYAPYYSIAAKPGKTYVVAAQAHSAGHHSIEWAWGVVKMPQDEQYADLGQVTVIDTPRGPAILLDELWEACGQ